jgi:pimeloyl-ACP methyl ester carboxylesterase
VGAAASVGEAFFGEKAVAVNARASRRTVARMNDAILHVNGIDLHYETYGRGEPLLWLHGMGGCAGDLQHCGRDRFSENFEVIAIDARGHGLSTNVGDTVTHRQHALDVLALLDHLGISGCKALGCSMGGNTLLHVATLQPARVEAMVVVSPTMYFPESARAIMRQTPDAMTRALAEDVDDLSFTPPRLARITARTLVVYGDRDFLYPVEMGVDLYRAIRGAALWVVPHAGHGPIFEEGADAFATASLAFLARRPT